MFKSGSILISRNDIFSHRGTKFKNAFEVALLHRLKVSSKQFSPYSSQICEASSDCSHNYIHLIELTHLKHYTQARYRRKIESELSCLTCDPV